jgi:hypothetical protein
MTASLGENLPNPARLRILARSELRVTTALRTGSDAAIDRYFRKEPSIELSAGGAFGSIIWTAHAQKRARIRQPV